MIGSILYWILVFWVIAWGYAEIRRYRHAKIQSDGISYPRYRLIRRSSVSVLVLGLIFGLRYKPSHFSTEADLIWYGSLLIATFSVIGLAMRDLHSTSAQLVKEHGKIRHDIHNQMENELIAIVDKTSETNINRIKPQINADERE